MNTLYKILSLIVITSMISSCGNDEDVLPDPFSELVLLTSEAIESTGKTLRIFTPTNESLLVGYNSYQVGLFDTSGSLITNSNISVIPMMHMEGMESNSDHMQHSAPHEQFSKTDAGLHSFATVFQMPSSEMNQWHIHIMGKDLNTDESFDTTVELSVAAPEVALMKSFVVDDIGHFVSLVESDALEVGMNDFELTIHKKMGMMDWPSVEGLIIEIEPEMPAMGHGSPNNINPVHIENGHYKGSVNFTMTGYWKINVKIYNDIELLVETSFDITL